MGFLLILCLAVAGCGTKAAPQSSKLKVAASFYPMAEFARQVGGANVEVTTLIPEGLEPHEWEPTAQDLTKIKDAGLFIYNGVLEPWAPKAIQALGQDKVRSVEAGQGLMLINGKPDPHVWVSPKLAQKEVDAIQAALSAADPAHKDQYAANASAYKAKLQKLDQQLQQAAAKGKHKEFVTTHAAFGHLAHDYHLKQLSILGISPEAEPAPASLTQLVNLVREKNIHYVFFESLVSPKVAKSLAAETSAQILMLNPLEGLTQSEKDQGADYMSIMEQNIKNLQKALE